MINLRNIKLSVYGYVLLGAVVLFGMVTCTQHLTKIDEQRTAIRDANGGVIPGKEAIDNNGGRYNLQTIIHNGNEYTCFRTGSAMGCAKE